MVWPPPLVSGYVDKPSYIKGSNDNGSSKFKSQERNDNAGLDQSFNGIPLTEEPESVNEHNVQGLHTCDQHLNLTDLSGFKPESLTGSNSINENGFDFVVKPTSNVKVNMGGGYECPPPIWPDKIVMSPPHYGDLGKQARDVFGKGYHFGLLKLDIKTKTNTGVEFSTGGVSNRDTGKVFGSLESKYKFKDYGVTFTERWNTDNVLSTDISLSDFCQGAKVSLDTSFAPHTGDKSVKIKGEFHNDVCAVNLDTDFKQGGPVLRGSAVVGYSGWLLGYLTAFDASKSKLTENKLSMGFVTKDFVLNTSINDGRVFSGSIFHKVNPSLETGVQLSWAADNNDTDFGIGCKYALDSDASLRFKVNNQSLIGLAYQQKLKDGVSVFLSCQIDGKNFNEGGHKIGFALELEA